MKRLAKYALSLFVMSLAPGFIPLAMGQAEFTTETSQENIEPETLDNFEGVEPESLPEGYVEEVIALTNQERAKVGLKALIANALLAKAAQGHATDMATKNYFSHTSLSGLSPFQRMRNAGYYGRYMGENIAAGYRTPAEVVRGWMNSEGHRKNILNVNYADIGVGYAYSSTSRYRTYWVQNFGRR